LAGVELASLRARFGRYWRKEVPMAAKASQNILEEVRHALNSKMRASFQEVETSLGLRPDPLDVTAALVFSDEREADIFLCGAAGLWTIHLECTTTIGEPSKGTKPTTAYAHTLAVTPWHEVAHLECRTTEDRVKDLSSSSAQISFLVRGIEPGKPRRVDLPPPGRNNGTWIPTQGEQAKTATDAMGFFAAVARRMGKS